MIAGMQCSELSHAAGFTRVARRNNSLSSTGRLLAFGFIFVVSVGIAVAFAIIGAWPILPFAGLEMLVLCLAFRAIGRRAADYERIAIDGDRVRVEIREAGQERGHEFNRAWAQVVVGMDSRSPVMNYPLALGAGAIFVMGVCMAVLLALQAVTELRGGSRGESQGDAA